jgi:SAM-dependent MidA family methyltransferase
VNETVERLLRDKIRSGGPIPFATFMSQALYHPEAGYYSGPPRTGWHGHFLTSPELDPAFGELWAAGLQEIWEATGSPDAFEIAEIGPGEGGFARAVLGALQPPFSRAVRYRLIERSPAAQERQRALLAPYSSATWFQSIGEMPPIDQGVIIANEVLDNLPVHIVERRGQQLQELWVGEREGRFVPLLQAPSTPDIERFLARHQIALQDGMRLEVGLAAELFTRQVTELLRWGAVVFIDYGAEQETLAERPEGTMVCYSGAGTDTDPFDEPGDKDITVFANWSVVRRTLESAGLETIGPSTQREILMQLGLAELDARFRAEHTKAMVSGKGGDAVRALSRRQALGALSDPSGLGGLQVLFGLKEIVASKFMRMTTTG